MSQHKKLWDETLVYIMPDIRWIEKEAHALGDLSEYERHQKDKYKQFFQGLYEWLGPISDAGYIKDYWLVLTPSAMRDIQLSNIGSVKVTRESYIVTRFNEEDLRLIAELLLPRSGLPLQASISAYAAIEMNEESDYLCNLKQDFGDRNEALAQIAFRLLTIQSIVADGFIEQQDIRTFLHWKPVKAHVEQYFNSTIKKRTNVYGSPLHLGDGYFKDYFTKKSVQNKYISFSNAFQSTGWEIEEFGRSGDELRSMQLGFSHCPWSKNDFNFPKINQAPKQAEDDTTERAVTHERIAIEFKTKVKLFKKDGYELEHSDLVGIKVHAFAGKREIGDFIISLEELPDSSFNFDKTALDMNDWFSYASFEFAGQVDQLFSPEICSHFDDHDRTNLTFKAINLIAKHPNSAKSETLHLLLNDDGDWAPISIRFLHQ